MLTFKLLIKSTHKNYCKSSLLWTLFVMIYLAKYLHILFFTINSKSYLIKIHFLTNNNSDGFGISNSVFSSVTQYTLTTQIICLCPNSKKHHSKFEVQLMFAGGRGWWGFGLLFFYILANHSLNLTKSFFRTLKMA